MFQLVFMVSFIQIIGWFIIKYVLHVDTYQLNVWAMSAETEVILGQGIDKGKGKCDSKR